jgi:hypothetical protein
MVSVETLVLISSHMSMFWLHVSYYMLQRGCDSDMVGGAASQCSHTSRASAFSSSSSLPVASSSGL